MNFLLYDLGIAKYFPDVNHDYLKLALTPKRNKMNYSEYVELEKKHGIFREYYENRSFKTFEFYGDVALDTIVTSEMMDTFGLNITNNVLSKIKASIVSNITLTYLANELGICWNIYYMKPDAPEISMERLRTASDKHTICGNSIEGIIGALYYQYGIEKLPQIKNWFFSLQGVYEYMNDISCRYKTLNVIKFPPLKFDKNASVIKFIEKYEEYYPQYEFLFEKFSDTMYVYIDKKNCTTTIVLNVHIYSSDDEIYGLLKHTLINSKIWIPI